MMKNETTAPIIEKALNITIGVGAPISAAKGAMIVIILAASFAKPKVVWEKIGGNRIEKAR